MIITLNEKQIDTQSLLKKELKNDITVDLEGTDNANELITMLIALIDERQILEDIASVSMSDAAKYKKYHSEQINSISALEQKLVLQQKEIRDLREQNEELKQELEEQPTLPQVCENINIEENLEKVNKLLETIVSLKRMIQSDYIEFYDLCNSKITEIERLQEENDVLRKEQTNKSEKLIEEINFLQSSIDDCGENSRNEVSNIMADLSAKIEQALNQEFEKIKQEYLSRFEG